MVRSQEILISMARLADVPLVTSLRTEVAQDLTRRHGRGHWSSCPTERAVLRGLNTSHVLVARSGEDVVGTVRLESKKPWAIDVSYFAPVAKAVYLHDLAVASRARGKGIGQRLIEEAKLVACNWPSNAIRLDAYDHAAGAGPFYARCGFREVGKVVYRGVGLVYFELLL